MHRFIFKIMELSAASLLALALSGCVTSPQPAPTSATDTALAEPSEGEAAIKAPRFERVPVGSAGFEAYVPKGFPTFTSQPSEDGALVESAQLDQAGFTFALIGVKLSQPIAEGVDHEEVLAGYLEHIKAGAEVEASVGFGIGHRLDSAPDAKGIIDYWKTKDGQTVSVKGWITKHHIAVYTIWGDTEYPLVNVQALYFDGVRFPSAEAE